MTVYKIEYLDQKQLKAHQEKFGGYNAAPPNFKEISQEEFAQSAFHSYTPIKMEFRQIIMENQMLDSKLFFYSDGTGYAIHADYYGKRLRFFRFALCEHEFKELSSKEAQERAVTHYGHCYHVYECKKCGYITAQDSSG